VKECVDVLKVLEGKNVKKIRKIQMMRSTFGDYKKLMREMGDVVVDPNKAEE
jgi:hypothetical protein